MGKKGSLHKGTEESDKEAKIKASIWEPNEGDKELVVAGNISAFTGSISGQIGVRIHGVSEGDVVFHLKSFK